MSAWPFPLSALTVTASKPSAVIVLPFSLEASSLQIWASSLSLASLTVNVPPLSTFTAPQALPEVVSPSAVTVPALITMAAVPQFWMVTSDSATSASLP